MAQILLTTLADALGGAVPTTAVLEAKSSRVRAAGKDVTAPQRVTVRITNGEPESPIVLEASGVDWYWTLSLSFPSSYRSFSRYVQVPDHDVEWADLVDIDRATMEPDPGAVPAWEAAVAEVQRLADQVAAVTLSTSDLRTFLLTGETMPADGVADASPLIQRALDALSLTVTQAGPIQLAVPEGRYRLLTALVPRSGVGIVGANRDSTVFAPLGDQPFMRGDIVSAEPAEGWAFLDDMLFADFSIDCTEQSADRYVSTIKAFYMQNVRRAKFWRLACYGSWASMFGVDFLIDSEFVDCSGVGSGRGGPSTYLSTGSTFAFGVGRFPDESIRLVNCSARDAAAAGFYFERLEGRGAFLVSSGYSLSGCTATGCGVGVNDAGTGGITATGCDFSRNSFEGWIAASGGQSSVGGTNGSLIGCTISGNADGVVFAGGGSGGYTIGGGTLLEDNAGAGVAVRAGTSLSKAGIRIQGVTLRDNGIGVHIEPGLAGRLSALTIDGCAFDGNAQAGVLIESGALGPSITGSTFTGETAACVRLVVDLPIDSPIIERNRWYDQDSPLVGTSGYAQARIRDNATLASIMFALHQITGEEPSAVIEGARSFEPVSVSAPTTTYVVVGGTPASSSWVRLRSSDNVVHLAIGRNSAGTSWVGSATNSAGALVYPTVTGAAVPTVLSLLRNAAGMRLHPRGLTQAMASITSYPAASVSKATVDSGYMLILLYGSEHDEAKRIAVMDALSAEYGIA